MKDRQKNPRQKGSFDGFLLKGIRFGKIEKPDPSQMERIPYGSLILINLTRNLENLSYTMSDEKTEFIFV
jgi:hypothetical protein